MSLELYCQLRKGRDFVIRNESFRSGTGVRRLLDVERDPIGGNVNRTVIVEPAKS